MGKDITPQYYKSSASKFGWGEQNAKLDKQRVELLRKYLFGNKILDIGCGTGIYVDLITNWGFDCYGLDHVIEFISKAKKEKKGTFVLGKAESLPFDNNSFDTIIIFDVLEHCDDLKVLKEARRVARKRILFIVPREVDTKLEQSGIIFRHYLDKSHLREYNIKDIKELAKKANFKIVYLEEVHPLNIRTIFFSLFRGDLFLKRLFFKITDKVLKSDNFPTEFFVVLEK